ncbi:DNA repair ATPase [Kitasatospora purpeofusca]|uniref:DNA repair ATPase n=1 Tax=Kitasatospora purpeofusca TaxID=67352 RepID=UPI002259250A|nr:DNA repair ATPase [Kitasatospora purpeofusca]MCX4758635.1 DNA repair ATPase [Kitasatospora purpeofusca]WSR30929.1 DNA repair ATPase [Kitasatospora purpeofusca]
MTEDVVDDGTYEVLRARLRRAAADLTERAQALNARRVAEFGGGELTLAGTGRLAASKPLVLRDVAAVGGLLLAGWQHTGGAACDDILTLHRPDLTEAPAGALPGLLDDPRLRQDLDELHRYYRDARLERLRLVDGRLLALFRTGPAVGDLRVLRWDLAADGTPAYLDARGERDHVPANGRQLDWTGTTRTDHRQGRPPAVSLSGELLLSTDGGTLRLATPDGRNVHEEPLDEPLQALADSDIAHGRLDTLLLVRIKPYREETVRHLVCHLPTGRTVRIDALGQSCLRLPADQGLVFPGGYVLTDGTHRVFDRPTTGLRHERTIASPNGEDTLFVFRDPADGRTLLLPYNSVRQEAAAPLLCQGYALLDDGTLIAPHTVHEPARLHPVQTWRTPFTSERHAAAQPTRHSPLARIGNPDLVRGLADCLALARLATARTDTTAGYQAVLTAGTRTTDRHHWLAEPGLGDLHTPLGDIRETARQAITEHETAAEVTAHAATQVTRTAEHVDGLLRRTRGETLTAAAEWIAELADLHRTQGQIEALRELPRADTHRIDLLAERLAEGTAEAARRAADFLAEPDAFTDHHRQAAELADTAGSLTTAADAAPLAERIAAHTEAAKTVAELVTTLEPADPTVRTAILDRLTDILGLLNRARSALDTRRRELRTREAAAEFAAESALLAQATAAALAAADTPQTCDEQLTRLMLRIEQLDTRFADADAALTEQLTARRDEIHHALSARRQNLLDERARHTQRLAASADRLLDAIRPRLAALGSPADIDAALAADPMAVKIRQLAGQLADLGDPVRAEEAVGRLRAARQQAHRALRDRADQASDGPGTLRLGRHLFTTVTQRPELTLVHRQGHPTFTLTGTDYHAPVTDPDYAATERFWEQPLVSETPGIYRAEYLAATLLLDAEPDGLDALHEAAARGTLAELVRRAAEERHDEGYQRGVHDHDATAVLQALLTLHTGAGLLRHPAAARATAQLFWTHGADDSARTIWAARARSLGAARAHFGTVPALDTLADELDERIAEFTQKAGLPATRAGAYLVAELAHTTTGFAARAAITALLDKFHAEPGTRDLAEALTTIPDEPARLPARHQLASAWLEAFTQATGHPADTADLAEAVATLLTPDLPRYSTDGAVETTVTGLAGDHPRLDSGALTVRLDELLTRTADFRTTRIPEYRAYQHSRARLLEAERNRLRLEQYHPQPLDGFVRNRLIDEVYLPLVGDNLAKQLGTAGDGARTDRSGLLLLVSPPGYGKTTLVEYLADRLGLLLVKVSGPALGHRVTSLDPAETSDATARREIEKINFALHVGTNVLLHLDDIQHTSPELLQRFIPLCDAQRRIDGVWDGRAREWDLRGKRFAVVMAANPYTESGRNFRIPDMLANRADVWNLGDVVAGRDDLFGLSFIENTLTANPHLAPLATAEPADLDTLLRRATGESSGHELFGPWPAAETERMTAVLAKLLRVRSTVLAVNGAYLRSAAQSDRSRTEPPFLLQGSYRNMARIAQRVVPAMDDTELDALVTDHYRAEAQPLGADAEAQLLKLAELRGTLTPDQAARWEAVKADWPRMC